MKKSTTQTMKKNKLTNTDQEKLGVVIFIANRLNSRKTLGKGILPGTEGSFTTKVSSH